ncbi:hypothetical protein BH10ACI1_BH10ACI1_06090 [soil metagenome]
MLSKRILPISFVLLVCSVNFYAQMYISGQVVGIVDGRTLLVETAKDSRVKFRLQYIEVPEAEQPLAEVVKSHLRDLAFGKTVNIRSNSISRDTIIIGQVILNGADLSRQMLRDGAAWFYFDGAENLDDYKAMEAAAKTEKRGIWGVEGLKPAWEFRKDKEIAAQKKLQEEKKANEQKLKQQSQEKEKENITQQKKSNSESNSNLNNLDPNLVLEYDKTTNESFVSSPMQKFTVSDDTNSLEILLGFGYEFVGNTLPKNIDNFGIAVGSVFAGANFLRANEVMIFTDDGKKLILGKPKSKFSVQNGQIIEVLFYKIERAELVKLTANSKPSIKIGKYQRVLEKPTLNIINILLRTTV